MNLYLDVQPRTGNIKYTRPELEPSEMPHSCALDTAERGAHTLDQVGALLNVTRERIRQIEEKVARKALRGRHPVLAVLKEFAP